MRGLLLLLIRPILGLDMGIEMFKEILNFPLRSNPFFSKIISLGDNFGAEGIEDGQVDTSGYVCQHLGNLECEDGFKPQCSGLGVIDCAGECAGTEEEFKKFMEVMEDKDFDKKFPELAKVKKSQEKQENKAAEIPLDGGESVSAAEEKEDVRTKFMKGLLKCTNFSQETMALLSLMNPNGEGGLGNQDTSDPNSKVFVDPAALSQISEVEYDYSDLYDYEDDEMEKEMEVEAGKSRRDIKEEVEMTTRMAEKRSTEKPATRRKPLVLISKVVETIIKKKKQTKEDKASYLQSLNEGESKMSEEEKISMNVIRSAGEELVDTKELVDANNEDQSERTTKETAASTTARYADEIIKITVMNERSEDEVTSERSRLTTKPMVTSTGRLTTSQAESVEPGEPAVQLKENLTIANSETRSNGTAVDLARKERIKRELVELQALFEATMAALSGFEEEVGDPSVHRVAWRLRTKRADKGMESGTSLANNTQPDADACVVRNMTCVKFPSRKHCKGIALGRCGSRTDLLVALFTPHVVMVTIVSVFVFVIVAIGLSYYCYRLRAENKIGPTDTGSMNGENEKDEQVKQVQPVQDG